MKRFSFGCATRRSSPIRRSIKNLMQEAKRLAPIVEKYRQFKAARDTFQEAKALLDAGGLDKEFHDMVFEELEQARAEMERTQEELKVLLLPRDPNDEKNVIVEIRGGAGGRRRLCCQAPSCACIPCTPRQGLEGRNPQRNETELGGFKEVSFMIEGEGAYSRLKFESGVHRVQRVPETESQGRIHTSTVTVAVLPEAEEVDVEINPADLQIDTYRSGGAGGQHVNKTESAIRITHLPTGTVVECQDERSQYKNKDRAMKILRSRILEAEREKQHEAIAGERRAQVGTGDRSERIRTYNFPQGRVSDHRIGLTLYKIEQIMNGALDEVIDALITADTAEKLKAESDA